MENTPGPGSDSDLSRLVAQAVAACERGDHDTARKCLAAVPPNKLVRCQDAVALGYVALNLGGGAAALDWFTTAVQLDPAQASAHAARALMLQLLNRSAEARQSADTALWLDANDRVALKVLARICINGHRLVEAQAYCQQILELNPSDADARTMLLQCGSPQPVVQLVSSPNTFSVAVPATPTVRANPQPSGSARLDGLLGDYPARCEAWEKLGVEHLLQQLVVGDFKKAVDISTGPAPAATGADGLPLPPPDLTMGYGAGNLDAYLACGRKSYASLMGLLQQQAVELGAGDALLDWGGASGRVVRQFLPEARRGCEVWGCDVHAPSIQWAQGHLSPPFKFFNSSILPHLPFPDGRFKFIYGLSVMTHMVALRDLWLLELGRVLRPDGCLILTVHNESTWTWFRDHNQMPHWMPDDLKTLPDMPGECVEIRGSRWEHVYTFFHSAYLRRVWGQYFRVADIVPAAEGYQTAVVLRKL